MPMPAAMELPTMPKKTPRTTTIALMLALAVLTAGCRTIFPSTSLYPTVDQKDDWDWINQRSHG